VGHKNFPQPLSSKNKVFTVRSKFRISKMKMAIKNELIIEETSTTSENERE
jgi:hypothetical protein